MTIYTRGGDAGQTSLANGMRLPKNDPRVEAYGELDEATSVLGLAIALQPDAALRSVLQFVQQRLYSLAALVAGASDPRLQLSAADNAFLEAQIDRLMAQAPPLRHFILPAGDATAAQLHVARCVLRRAERRVVALGPEESRLSPQAWAFLNRASDLLFAAARATSAQAGQSEVPFDPSAPIPKL